jgi:DNA-binding NarL/FixJ family response regulator
MPRDRVRPIPSHAALRVGVHVRPLSLSEVVADLIVADGFEPRSLDEIADDERSAVVVCGWPRLAPGEQRRRTRHAVERLSGHRIVLIANIGRRSTLERFLAEGVDGLVLREQLGTTLCPTVRAVAAGQLCVPATIRQAVEKRPLSLREREVLALVVMGQSNGQIARRLHLAESTVKSHLVSTFAKLGVRSRAEAAQVVSDPQRMLTTGVVGLSGATSDGEDGQWADF